MASKIILALLFLSIFLFINSITSQRDDRDENDIDFVHQTYQIDNTQRFGRIRFSEHRQNDEEYSWFQTVGLYCTTVAYDPYSLWYEDEHFTFDVSWLEGEENFDHVPIMITPNHMNKQSNINEISSMIAFHTRHQNHQAQMCVLDYSFYQDDFYSVFLNGVISPLDISNSAADWMHITDGSFGIKTYVTGMFQMGCKTIPIDPVDVDNTLFFVTLEHTYFFTYHYIGYIQHYDSVWIEEPTSTSVKVCWMDDNSWDRSHPVVNIQVHVMPTSDSAPASTKPVPNKDYYTGKYEIVWTDDEGVKVICNDIAFKNPTGNTPLVFASYELSPPQNPEDNFIEMELDGGSVWVEEANESGMKMCYSEKAQSDMLMKAGDKIIVSYMVVYNVVSTSDQDDHRYQTGQGMWQIEGFNEIKCMEPGTEPDEKNKIQYSEEFIEDTRDFLFRYFNTDHEPDGNNSNMIHKIEGAIIPGRYNAFSEKEPPKHEVNVFFNIMNQKDVESMFTSFETYVSENTRQVDEECTRRCATYFDPSNEEDIAYFNKYIPEGKTIKDLIFTYRYGASCVYGPSSVSECVRNDYPHIGNYQNVSKTIHKPQFGMGYCDTTPYKSPCSFGTNFSSFTETHFTTYDFDGSEGKDKYTITYDWKNQFEPTPLPSPPNFADWTFSFIDDVGSNTTNNNTSNNNGGEEEEKEKAEASPTEGGGGIPTAIFVIVVIILVVVVVAEFIAIQYYNNKSKNTSYFNSPINSVNA